MGYLGYAVLFTVILGGVTMLYTHVNLGKGKKADLHKVLNVTIPEDLDYTQVFDDIFDKYTASCELVRVKTTNMGSLFRLSYHITLKKDCNEKEMIDAIRCRNGNLEISLAEAEDNGEDL